LSGLGIVRKNRRIPKHFNSKKVFVSSRTHCFYIDRLAPCKLRPLGRGEGSYIKLTKILTRARSTAERQNPRPLGRKGFNSVLSLRSFKHEFTRFEKKHYPWSDLTNKNTPIPQLFITKARKIYYLNSAIVESAGNTSSPASQARPAFA
jgi:hypothetical protein